MVSDTVDKIINRHHTWTGLSSEEKKKLVTQEAMKHGLMNTVKVAAITVPAVLLLHRYNPLFRRGLGVSGKTATAVMPPLFAFAFTSEQIASKMGNPDAFKHAMSADSKTTLPMYKLAANYIYTKPVNTLVMVSSPIVAGIYIAKGGAGLSLSMRLMHTRVLGQFSVLSVLVGTMIFYDYMSKRGRFLEPWEAELEAETTRRMKDAEMEFFMKQRELASAARSNS